MPAIRRLFFNYCDTYNSDLLEFLKYSAPTSTKLFTFGRQYKTDYQQIEYYVDGLEVALKAVTQEVWMGDWTASKDSLQRLVKAASGVSKLVFYYSKMDLDSDLDFSGPDYKIQHIGLPYCKNLTGSWCGSKAEEFERIIKALSQCSIKDSLQTLNVYECGIAVDKVKQMLKDHGMGAVSVVDESKDCSPTE